MGMALNPDAERNTNRKPFVALVIFSGSSRKEQVAYNHILKFLIRKMFFYFCEAASF